MVAIVYSEIFLKHLTGRGHAERPDRVRFCVKALQSAPFAAQLVWLPPREATIEELSWIHRPDYIREVAALCAQGGGRLDEDTPVSADSYDVALLAAGAWLVGVDQVVDQGISTFALARPPGHHARPADGMGFCIFSNAALAAHYAARVKGLERVAVFDWDVHHGNGTQEILETDPRFAYCSMHQSPCYPGTGMVEQTGRYHNVLNIPLPPGRTGLDYCEAFDRQVAPFLKNFDPQLLIISAGFDANRADPLASMALTPMDYRDLTIRCLALQPALMVGLEGGYDLAATSQSVLQVTEALL
ncbi:histone deacetylase family protein [Anthocerotibacter panamensis]|uniref:histone deacetylase family protein n=1 Tax=Anthocerotibacter panamensis TaxID=2857077 RepID=UPI001C40349D|nr:histone deacetylase [Anthocerotibacter panamensis]